MFLKATIPALPRRPIWSAIQFLTRPGRLKLLRTRSRQAWWKAHAGEPRSFLYTLQPGIRMELHLDSELCRVLYCEEFEAAERAFLNAFLRPGDVFVDVGANIGVFALIASQRVGDAGRVLAFEPTPRTFERLSSNVRLNHFSNISLHQLALSDRAGDMELFESQDGYDSWNSFGKPYAGKVHSRQKVPVTTWDAFSGEHRLNGRVTMMKIDVEGWETFVLKGGAGAFSQPNAPLLQVEFTDDAAKAAGCSCQEVYRLLEDLGFRLFRFDPASHAMIPDPLRPNYPYLNLYAAKDLQTINARLQAAPHR